MLTRRFKWQRSHYPPYLVPAPFPTIAEVPARVMTTRR